MYIAAMSVLLMTGAEAPKYCYPQEHDIHTQQHENRASHSGNAKVF
jgi:hypothetical protein